MTRSHAVVASLLLVLAAALSQVGSARTADLWTINSNPVWSPDGTSVAWAEVSPNGSRYRIETAAATAMSTPQTVYSAKAVDGDCCHSLTWARSGRFIFISNFTLLSVPVTGGRATVLFHGSTPGYLLSPNQETVVVVDGCACGHATDKIAFVNVFGGAAHELPVAKNVSEDPVAFSPDGTQLVFSVATHSPTTDQWSNRHLMEVHVGGGAPVPLAKSGILGAQYVTTHMTPVAWSPNGNWIAAWLRTTSSLRLITIDTQSGRTILAAPPAPWIQGSSPVLWSPDSTRLAFEATLRLGNNFKASLATVAPDGTNRKVFWNRASNLTVVNEAPAWSPDSSKLLFLAQTASGDPPEVLTAGANGGTITRIH
jgi:Tol biopolymer transport system component